MPIRARPASAVLPDRVAWPTREQRLDPEGGTIYSANVYHGAPPELRGKAKYLRVLHIEQKTYTYWNHRPALSTGPVVSLLQSDGVKRILGTVPIYPDGSCWFRVPTGVALHFQLLDENHRTLQTMRSFANVMPGESRGCLGCHEQHSRAPQQGVGPSQAVRTAPDPITPVPWAFETAFAVAPEGCATLEQALACAAKAEAKADPARAAHNARFGTSVGYLKDCSRCSTGTAAMPRR